MIKEEFFAEKEAYLEAIGQGGFLDEKLFGEELPTVRELLGQVFQVEGHHVASHRLEQMMVWSTTSS